MQDSEFDGTKRFEAIDDRAESAGPRIHRGAHGVGTVEFDAPHRQQPVDARVFPIERLNDSGVAHRRRGLANELTRKMLGVAAVAVG